MPISGGGGGCCCMATRGGVFQMTTGRVVLVTGQRSSL